MVRVNCNRWATLFLALIAIEATATDKPDDALVARAKALHQNMISLDAHVDIPFDFATESADPGDDGKLQYDLPKLERGGLAGTVLAVFVPQTVRNAGSYEEAQRQGMVKLNAIHRMADFYPSRIAIAQSTDDVRRLRAAEKPFVVIGMLNGFPLGSQAERLDEYFERGLRQLAFNHAGNNDLSDSSRPQSKHGDDGPEHGGLSELGREVIRRMNRLGIIVDVSQLTPNGVGDVLKVSQSPVIASHSAMRSRIDHPRNLSNDEMKRIADAGGVVHIVAFGGYLIELPFSFPEKLESIRDKYNAPDDDALAKLPENKRADYNAEVMTMLRALPRATMADYIDTIEAAIELIGIDHVGIGSDFNHGGGIDGYANVGEAFNVTAALIGRGYSDADIAKLWGGNWLRVFGEVERVSAGLTTELSVQSNQ